MRAGTTKQVALLAYLACQPDWSARRDTLIGLLWPDVSYDKGRRSLNQAVYDLRRRLPELELESSQSILAVAGTCMEADVRELEAALDDSDAEATMAIARGAFLEGFEVPSASSFNHWRDGRSGELRMRARSVVLAAARDAAREGRARDVLPFTTYLLEQDQVDLDAFRLRLDALRLLGDSTSAVAEVRRFRDRYLEEYGQELDLPEPLGAPLEGRTGADDLAATDENLPPPFVGRAREFDTLVAAWERCTESRGSVAIIRGRAGIGKTRLAEHFLRYAAIKGGRILATGCYPAQSKVPYGPIGDLLREDGMREAIRALGPPWGGVLASDFLAEAGPGDVDASRLDPDTRQQRLQESVLHLLRSVCARRPAVLFVDDWQWADEATRALISYLARRLSTFPALLLLTYRSEPGRYSTPTGLPSTDNATAVVLSEFDTMQTRGLVLHLAEKAGASVSDETIDFICSRSGGLPFYAVELARNLFKGRSGAQGDASGSKRIADTVEQHVAERLVSLTDNAARCVNTLAALGGRGGTDLVRRVSDVTEWAFLDAVAELNRNGIVREVGCEIEFVHGIMGEVADRNMGHATRRLIHGRVADSLRSRGAPPGQIARHLELAGDPERLRVSAIEAADEASAVNAYSEAEYFLRMALAASSSPTEVSHVKESLLSLYLRTNQNPKADDLLEDLGQYYREHGDTNARLRVDVLKTAVELRRGQRSVDAAIAELAKYAESAEANGDYPVAALALNRTAVWVHNSLNYHLFPAIGTRLIEMADRLPRTPDGLEARALGIMLTGVSHSVSSARSLAEAFLAESETFENDLDRGTALRCGCHVLLQAGLLERAEALFEELVAIRNRYALDPEWQEVNNNLAVLRMEQGRYGEAVELLEGLRASATDNENVDALWFVHYNLGLTFLECGDFHAAESVGLRLREILERLSTRARLQEPWSILGIAALEQGKLTEANRWRREILLTEEPKTRWYGDVSYRERFLARMAELDGREAESIERFREGIAAYEDRDFFCRSRMKLELARLLAELEPEEAESIASEVRSRGAEVGARPLVDRADEILDRIRFRGG